ncbi:MAG: hypothetical protein OES15_04355 [Nitrosopumilus sp.]|nr:hypothetical protein [Nitrosopumilus sp.]
MAYRCKHCSYSWDASEGDIAKLLAHEKTHLKDKAIRIAGQTT